MWHALLDDAMLTTAKNSHSGPKGQMGVFAGLVMSICCVRNFAYVYCPFITCTAKLAIAHKGCNTHLLSFFHRFGCRAYLHRHPCSLEGHRGVVMIVLYCNPMITSPSPSCHCGCRCHAQGWQSAHPSGRSRGRWHHRHCLPSRFQHRLE